MATVNIGNIKFNWKGPWQNGTTYVVDDVVSLSGASYISIQGGAGQNPASASAYWQQMSSAGTNGTDLTSTLTTQGDIVYRDGSGLQRLGYGTAGQVLQTGGSGANPSWGTVSSDYVKIASSTLGSDASALIIDNCFTSTYDVYDIEIINYKSDTTGANSQLRVKFRKGGASGADQDGINYSSVYDQAYGNFNSSSQTRGGSKQYNTTGFYPFNTWNQPSNSFNHGSFRMHHVQGNLAMWGGTSGGRQGNSGESHWAMYTSLMSDVAVDKGVNQTGMKIFAQSGNMKAGTKLTIYGIKS